MDPMFQDERISAYLDGQLPPDERSQFEDELARNGELRQVVEELRGLHDSLQELPRHRLNDDFAVQVLRRAERAMLSDPHVVAAAANGSSASGSSADALRTNGAAADDAKVVRAGVDNSFQDARKRRRPWVWAAIVVAAAIVVMVYNPPQRKPTEVAARDAAPTLRTPDQSRFARSLPEGQITDPAAVRDTKQSDEADFFAKERKSAVAANGEQQFRKRVEDGDAGTKSVDGLSSGGAFAGRRATEKDVPPAERPATALQTPSSQSTLGDLSTGRGDLDQRAKANGAVAGGGISPGRDFGYRSNLEQPADAPTNRPAEGRPVGKPESISGPVDRLATNKGAGAVDVQFGETVHGQAKSGALGRGPVFTTPSLSYESAASGKMFVAEVATEAGVQPEAFQQLLEKRGIALDSSPAANLALISAVRSASNGTEYAGIESRGGASGGLAGFGNGARAGASGNGSVDKTAEGLFAAPSADKDNDGPGVPKTTGPTSNYAAGRPNSALGANSLGLSPKLANASDAPTTLGADDESLEVVYVVGTRKQVMGLFDDLSSHPAQFRPLALTEVNQGVAEERAADAKPGEDRLSLDAKADKAAPKVTASVKNGTTLEGFSDDDKSSSPAADLIAPSAPPSAPAPAPSAPPASPPGAPLAKTDDKSPPAQVGRFVEQSDKKPGASADGQPVAGASAPAGAKEKTAKLPAPKLPAAPLQAAPLSAAKQNALPQSGAAEPATPQPAAIDAAVPAPVVEELKMQQKKADLAAQKPEKSRVAAPTESESLAESGERANGSSWASPVRSLPKDIEDDLRQALAERQNQPTDRNRQFALRELRADSAKDARSDRAEGVDKASSRHDVQLRQEADEKEKVSLQDGAESGDQVQAVFVFRLSRGNPGTTAATAAAPSKPVAAPTLAPAPAPVTSPPAALPPAETPATAPGKASK
jgi:anti-sigma factor RsiW